MSACPTIRPGEAATIYGRGHAHLRLNGVPGAPLANLNCHKCVLLINSKRVKDKAVRNPCLESFEQFYVDAKGDKEAAHESIAASVHSLIAKAKAARVKKGNSHIANSPICFLEKSFLEQKMYGLSLAYIKDWVKQLASEENVRFVLSGYHVSLEIRSDVPLIESIYAMILIQTMKAYNAFLDNERNLCAYCKKNSRYCIRNTKVMSFSKEIGCPRCLFDFFKTFAVGESLVAVVPSVPGCGRDPSIIVLPPQQAENKLEKFENIPGDALCRFAFSEGTYNPTQSQLEDDLHKYKVSQEKARKKEAEKTQKRAKKVRLSVESAGEAPRLGDTDKSAASTFVSTALEKASEAALDVDGASVKDCFVSVNFASGVPGETENSFTLSTRNEDISHIAIRKRLFFLSASTDGAMEEGKEYMRLNIDASILSEPESFESILRASLQESRKKCKILVVIVRLTVPCYDDDAKCVEKSGHAILMENDTIIPLDPPTYNLGSKAGTTDYGSTNLFMMFDACSAIKSGSVRLCATTSTQSFINTMKDKAPIVGSNLSFWSFYGESDSLATTASNTSAAATAAAPRNDSLDVKPAAAANSAAAKRSGALRNLDPNTAVPPSSKRTKRPTPEQLKGKIVVTSGTTTKKKEELIELFASYDEAEFSKRLPAINRLNRDRVILVKGEMLKETDKVRKAREKGVRIINDEIFMKMLA